MATVILPASEDLVQSFGYDPESGIVYHAIRKAGYRGNILPGTPAGCLCRTWGYILIGYKNKTYFGHRIIWKMMTGQDPIGDIDHINGDKADNRWCNLREATRSENKRNVGISSANSTGYKGVCWNKERRRYQAKIGLPGRKTLHLGWFSTAEAAHKAYCLASAHYHGEFGRTA